MYTHESSGAISNSGFPISSFKHAYLMCFYNLHEVRHWDQIVYLAHSQHVIHVCTKLWHVCCTVVLPLSKSYSRTEHRAKMYNTRRHRNSNTSSHESLLLLWANSSELQREQLQEKNRSQICIRTWQVQERLTRQFWTQRQCSSIHSKLRMSLLMTNLPMRWMMRNCISLTTTGCIRFVPWFLGIDIWCPQTVA